MGVFTWLLGVLRAPAALVLPFLGRARRSTLLLRILLWTVHVLIVAALLVGLHFLNQAWKLDERIPNPYWILRQNWLPILFLLVYVLCWLGWWLWKLLVTDDSYSEFPDITEAWEQACQALRQARIDPREVPLFLVVGRTEGSMEALFKAAKLPLDVKQAPTRDEAPLHVFATRDAVYVTCEGASVLGRHAAALAGEGGDDAGGGPIDEDDPLNKTNQPGKAPGAVPEIAAVMARARAERRELSAEERRRIRTLMRQDRVRQPVVRNTAEVELLGARFEHLCHLLVRDRWPYCPVNGMLLLLPFAATDTDQDALDAGTACQRDLSVARRVLQVNCPTLALVCDLETAPGFAAFLEQFPEKQRQQRIGQRSPMVPALEARNGRSGDDEARVEMLESLAEWICGSVAPGWVYKHFRMESDDPTAGAVAAPAMSRTDKLEASRGGQVVSRGGRADVLRTNAELFLFMHHLRERQRRLGRMLSRGVVLEDEEPILFGGCYLAGTGADSHREQAFVAGVFHRLAGEENFVSWTTQARAEEDSYQRWAFLGQMFLAVLFLATIALWAYLLFGKK